MANKHYMKGYRKERAVVNRARERGKLAFRSAGSHTIVDVVIIDERYHTIDLIQCKPDSLSFNTKKVILKQGEGLNGQYTVRFYVQ